MRNKLDWLLYLCLLSLDIMQVSGEWLLNGIWAVVWYVGYCMVCGMYGVWAVVGYLGCCVVCGL